MQFLVVFLALSIGAAVAQNSPKWVPFPADHWPQEPDGFNGMKFDATQAETEKTIKLESCENKGNVSCKTTLTVSGKTFSGNVVFGVPHDPKTHAPIGGEGHLAQITANISKAEFAFVKAAFIKMYGQPHHVDDFGGGEYLNWIGNKAEIRLFVMGDDSAFVIAPNWRARGEIVVDATIKQFVVKDR